MGSSVSSTRRLNHRKDIEDEVRSEFGSGTGMAQALLTPADSVDAGYIGNDLHADAVPADENKDNGDEATTEQKLEEQKQILTDTIAYLKVASEYATDDCMERFTILFKSSTIRGLRRELAVFLTEELGYGELYLRFHQSLYSYTFFVQLEDEEQDARRKQAQCCLRKMRASYWNFTDCSLELAMALGRCGALEVIVKELAQPELSFDKLKSDSRRNVVKGALGILHNSIRLCSDNRGVYRRAGAVEILHKLLQSAFLIVRVQCLLILSYIINEEESEKMTASDGAMDFLLTLVREALLTKTHKSKRYGFTVEELMLGINNLALNDVNKVKLVQKGGLDPLVKMLKIQYSDEEQKLAAELIWKLAFIPSNRRAIEQNGALMEVLTTTRTSCDSATLRETCTGALWEITEGKIDLPGHHDAGLTASSGAANEEDKHIMISYQWDVQKRMIAIKDQLSDAGYSVWMDVDKMEGDILGAMAEAVEKSAVVLVCLSQRYKDSHNTRTEATYTFKNKIPIIPLLVEKDYVADGWLGALVGTLLYFKFYEDSQVAENLPYLFQEIGNRGKALITMSKSLTTGASPPSRSKLPSQVTAKSGRAVVATWDRSAVQKWLEDGELSNLGETFDRCNGELLVQMYKQSQRAPEYFHSALRRDLGLDFLTILKLTSALDKLMT